MRFLVGQPKLSCGRRTARVASSPTIGANRPGIKPVQTLPDNPSASIAVKPFVVSNRAVLAIAVPMTLAYLTTPLLGIVDTAVIGQLGDAALLGGLAAGAIVFDVIFASFNFLRSGTTGLVARAFGRGAIDEEQAAFWRASIVALVSGVILAVLAPMLSLAGQWFIAGEARVSQTLDLYVRIRLFAAPVTLMNFVILGYVLGRGEGALALAIQIVLNGINIALSILLGLVLGWGVAGVAWGTVIGETVALLLGLFVVLRRFRGTARLPLGRVLDAPAYREMMALNFDILIRSFTLLAAFALFARQGAQFGTVMLAANAVLMNFFMAGAFFLDGFAAAAEQLAGRAVGARYKEGFLRAVRLCTIWGFVLAGFASALQLAFGESLIAFITTAEDVRAVAYAYLPWAALTSVTAVLAFQMDGTFIGAGWSRDMRNMMLLSLALFVAALLVLVPAFGNAGLWATLHIFLGARGLSLAFALRQRVNRGF